MNRNNLVLGLFVLLHLAGALLLATGAGDRHPRLQRPPLADDPDSRDEDESAFASGRAAWDEAPVLLGRSVHLTPSPTPRPGHFR